MSDADRGPKTPPSLASPLGAPPADQEPAELVEARALRKAHKPDDALKVAEAFLQRAPNAHWRFQAMGVIAAAYMDTFNEPVAMAVGHEMTAVNPGSPDGFIHVASAGLMIGKMRDAIEALETGLALHPRSHTLLALNSLRHARLPDPVRAMEWAERALAIAPDDADCLTAMAVALGLAGRAEEAKQATDQARAAYVKLNDTPTTAAAIAFEEQDFRRAFALSRDILADNPQNPKARQTFVRARIYKSPLFWPWFATSRLGWKKGLIGFGAATAVLYAISPPACAIAVAAVSVYYLSCLCIALLVEAVYDPRRAHRA